MVAGVEADLENVFRDLVQQAFEFRLDQEGLDHAFQACEKLGAAAMTGLVYLVDRYGFASPKGLQGRQ